jgi:hypothetical protein
MWLITMREGRPSNDGVTHTEQYDGDRAAAADRACDLIRAGFGDRADLTPVED